MTARTHIAAWLMLASVASADSTTLTLAWDAPTTYTDGTAIKGALTYRLYVSSAMSTASAKDGGKRVAYLSATGTTATVSNLVRGVGYRFSVAAVADGAESEPSEELAVRRPHPVARGVVGRVQK
jgi:hypothetical protein